MDTQRVAREIRLSQWAQMMQGRMENGQSIKEFCRAVGVSRNTYFYWQRKLRQAVCERHARDLVSTPAGRIESPSFTEVKVSEAQTPLVLRGTSELGQLRVETHGVKITVDNMYPPEKLAVLLREFLRTC